MKMKTIPRPPTPRRVPRRMVKTLHARAAASQKDFEDFEGESEPNMKFSHALIVVLVLHILAVGGVFAFNSLKGRHASQSAAKAATTQAAAPSSSPEVITSAKGTSGAPATDSAASAAAVKAPSKEQTESAGSTYTVLAGDTLTRIAAAHKTTVEALEQANGIATNSAIRVGQVLKIASKPASTKQEAVAAKAVESKPVPVSKVPEVVPSPKTTASKTSPAVKSPDVKPTPVVKSAETQTPAKPSAEPAKPDAKTAVTDKTYTVAKGDNPYSIAKKLKVSYNALIKANDIKDPTKLQIGQKLIIP